MKLEIDGGCKKATEKTLVPSGDKVVDRARARVPDLIRSLRLQFGNLGIGGKYDSVMEQMLEDAK